MSSPSPWISLARRLTGESASVRSQMLTELRAIPDLSATLRAALPTSDFFLALDVITGLELKSFVPTLLDFAQTDQTGYSYHAINSLLTGADQGRIFKIYLDRLLRAPSPASKLTLLDSLTRTAVDIKSAALEALLKDRDPEIRSAAIYYIRSRILKFHRLDHFDFLVATVKDPAFQVRAQSWTLIGEIPLVLRQAQGGSLAKKIAQIAAVCQAESELIVRSQCAAIR